jgi:hypothetical protein
MLTTKLLFHRRSQKGGGSIERIPVESRYGETMPLARLT